MAEYGRERQIAVDCVYRLRQSRNRSLVAKSVEIGKSIYNF
jgi:hypothetical protein